MNDILDYLKKAATAIGERYLNDRLDYQREKRLARLDAAPAPAPAPQQQNQGLPTWVLPAALAGALLLLLLIRRKG